MSSKSRQTREQHASRGNTETQMSSTPKPSKATQESGAATERTTGGGAQSKRLAKSSLPLRRGQRSS
ncbi:hypothetical protein [Nonomuraea africana]|uniref:Uncharacterized protein n=1 Tax=Nonomuraea africana TaxID=46171 RepID=A0ABR9K8W2_9ACTN|nr:hypothetical protein [Nonomuraea africana]MBE1558193.1 hypothetical protein [Nonomuraea africana]